MTYPKTDKISGLDFIRLSETEWQVTVFKPIYGTTVAINSRFISKAIREKATLIVRTWDMDTKELVEERIAPSVWRKESKKVNKIFLYQDNPMLMYQREVKGE